LLNPSDESNLSDVEENFENQTLKKDEKEKSIFFETINEGRADYQNLDLNGEIIIVDKIMNSNQENCTSKESSNDLNNFSKSEESPSLKCEKEQESIVNCPYTSDSEKCKMISNHSENELIDKICYQTESESSAKPVLIAEFEPEVNPIEFFNSSELSMPFGHYNSIEQDKRNEEFDTNLNSEFRTSSFFGISIDEDEVHTKMDSQVNPEYGVKFCADQPSRSLDPDTLNKIQAEQTLIDDLIGNDRNMSNQFTLQCQDKNVCSDLNKIEDKDCIDIIDNQIDKPDENIFQMMDNVNEIITPQPDSVDDQICSEETSFTVQDRSCTEFNTQFDDNFENSRHKNMENNCNPDLNVNQISIEDSSERHSSVNIMTNGWTKLDMQIQEDFNLPQNEDRAKNQILLQHAVEAQQTLVNSSSLGNFFLQENQEDFNFPQNQDRTENQNELILLEQIIEVQQPLVNSSSHDKMFHQEYLIIGDHNFNEITDNPNCCVLLQNKSKKETELSEDEYGKQTDSFDCIELMNETDQIELYKQNLCYPKDISDGLLDKLKETNNLNINQNSSQVYKEILSGVTQHEPDLRDSLENQNQNINPELIFTCSDENVQNDHVCETLEEKHTNENQSYFNSLIGIEIVDNNYEIFLPTNNFNGVQIEGNEHGNYPIECEKKELEIKEAENHIENSSKTIDEEEKQSQIIMDIDNQLEPNGQKLQKMLGKQTLQNENSQPLEVNAFLEEVKDKDIKPKINLPVITTEEHNQFEESQYYEEEESESQQVSISSTFYGQLYAHRS